MQASVHAFMQYEAFHVALTLFVEHAHFTCILLPYVAAITQRTIKTEHPGMCANTWNRRVHRCDYLLYVMLKWLQHLRCRYTCDKRVDKTLLPLAKNCVSQFWPTALITCNVIKKKLNCCSRWRWRVGGGCSGCGRMSEHDRSTYIFFWG